MLRSLLATVAIFIASIFGAHIAQYVSTPSQPQNALGAVAGAIASLSETATSAGSAPDTSNTTSNQPPLSPFGNSAALSASPSNSAAQQKSASSGNAVQSAPIIINSAPAFDASAFVTQDQFNAGLAALGQSLQQLSQATSFSAAASPPLGGGSPNTIAAGNAIDNLNNVTITNANLTASEIPNLSATYLPIAGGTVSGNLIVTGTFSGGGLSLATASTTNLSVFQSASFGGTATSTFDSAGDLTVGGSLSANGNVTLGNATTTSLFATTASSTNLFSTTANFGTLAAASLSLSSPLSVASGGTGSTTLSGLLKGSGTGALQSAIAGTDYQVPLAFSYPFLDTGNTISLGFGTTTANTWSGLQTLGSGFISDASSTIEGALTATGNLTISNGSGTVLSATGNGTLGTSQTISLNLAGGSTAAKVQAAGTNAQLSLQAANDQTVSVLNGSGGGIGQFFDAANGSSANYLQFRNATAGNGPTINAIGTDSNININYTVKGTGIHSFNAEVQAPIFDSTQPIYTLSGSSVTPVFNMTSNWTGTTTGSGAYPYEIDVPSDTVNASGATNGFSPFAAKFNFGGTGFSGGRNWFLLTAGQTGPISDSVSSQQYTLLPIWGFLNYSAGGTDANAGSKGSFYGTNPQVVLSSGATNWALTNTLGEVDTAWLSGSSGRDKYFASFIHLSTDAVQATRNDSFLFFGAQNGATAMSKTGLQWGGQGGPFPLDANVGTVSGIVLQQFCGNNNRSCQQPAPRLFAGDDYLNGNFSLAGGFPFRSPNFSVDGYGDVSIANATIATTSTGIKIDIPNQIVTGIVIAQSGSATGNSLNNYYPGDMVNGPENGQYQVATTKAIAATVVSGGSGGSNGACTVTGTTGTGTDFQASGTVTGGVLGGALTITTAGSYTTNPTSPAVEPITGCGLTGATVNVGIGIATLNILVPDTSASPPSNPVSLANGSGAGATANLTWSSRNVLQLNPTGGNVGIGTTTPYSRLEVWGPDTASTSAFAVVNSASTTEFSVYDTGNAVLAGGLTQSSDQRLKTNIQSLDASSSLAAINALNPVTFNWIDPNKGSNPQLGFIAQQVLPIFPNLVSTTSATALTPDGTLSLNYIGFIAPIISAIHQLNQELSSLTSTVADFANSFTTKQLTFDRATGNDLSVNTLEATTTTTQELCVGSTCVTPAQFQAMVAAADAAQADGSAVSPSGKSDGASTTPDAPPVIQVNGDNPAIIQVGDSYTDLGATITGPQADLNLGIATFVNGMEVNPVQIDTSTAATDTIDYVATDQSGLTATTTRTVIVEAAAAPPIVPSETASSTAASSTAK